MSDTGPRYWLMDWHGRVMDHDPVQDRLVMQDITVDRYPGIWFTCEDPEQRPMPIDLRKTVSLPSPLPRLTAIETGDGLVGLRDEEAERAGRAGPYAKSVNMGPFELGSNVLAGWERFAIISEPMLHGILILAQPHLSEIRDEDGQSLPPLGIIPEIRCEIGDIRVPVVAMRPALEQVAGLASGTDLAIELASEPARRITVRRL
jgi:hypothetical protein